MYPPSLVVGLPPITPNLAPLAEEETESGLFPDSLGTLPFELVGMAYD